MISHRLATNTARRIALVTTHTASIHRHAYDGHTLLGKSQSAAAVGPLFTVSGILGAGIFMNTVAPPSSRCSMEAMPSSKPKRRRPPIFGSSVPTITTRGLVTKSDDTDTTAIPDNIDDREDCPFCKKFSKGPCGTIFKTWLACTDKHPGKDASSGEPLHLSKCLDLAEKLGKCLSENEEFYSKNEDDDTDEDEDTSKKEGELKDAWREFVNEMENGIISGKYNITPFPAEMNPKMQISLASNTGASFFVPETKEGQPIIAAYILDENGNVIAAGSRDDMDMGGQMGCVLQFKLVGGMKSVTGRAIYDTEKSDIRMYSRTMMLPEHK